MFLIYLTYGDTYSKLKNFFIDTPKSEVILLNKIPLINNSIDLRGYLSIGDLDGDGQVEFVTHRHLNKTIAFISAFDSDGNILWTKGKPEADISSINLRGALVVYDINNDNKDEVITELLENNKIYLYILEGSTGKTINKTLSPLTLNMKYKAKIRDHSGLRVANLFFNDKPSEFILWNQASATIKGQVWALNKNLDVLWYHEGNVSHLPSVGDTDLDGYDEVATGDDLLDENGHVIWHHRFKGDSHVDDVMIENIDGNVSNGLEIAVSSGGHIVSSKGKILWNLIKNVNHGQRILVGELTEKYPGPEIFISYNGHNTNYLLANSKGLIYSVFGKYKPGFMDMPVLVHWNNLESNLIWIPQEQTLYNGDGEIVTDLTYTVDIQNSHREHYFPLQCIPANIAGDRRDELILYQPYWGRDIAIYTHYPYNKTAFEGYVAEKRVYNYRSYF